MLEEEQSFRIISSTWGKRRRMPLMMDRGQDKEWHSNTIFVRLLDMLEHKVSVNEASSSVGGKLRDWYQPRVLSEGKWRLERRMSEPDGGIYVQLKCSRSSSTILFPCWTLSSTSILEHSVRPSK
jgi:hypothetical protein